MVSFQCDACQDVVKKPKLDAHAYRCHGSFTCVDCSKTFRKPAEWKVHTSCISEAEKYQKGLYNSKKTNQNGSNGPQGGKSSKAGNEVMNGLGDSESRPSKDGTENKHFDRADTSTKVDICVGDTGNTTPNVVSIGTTDAVQSKEAKKGRKKKRKAHQVQEAPGDHAPTNEEGKNRKEKKRKLDAPGNDKVVTETDGTVGKEIEKKDVSSSSTSAVPAESARKESKRDKKKRKKKDKAKSEMNGEGDQTGAPSQADLQSPADPTKKHEAAGETVQRSDSQVDESGKDLTTPSRNDAADETLAKKTKKKERIKEKEEEIQEKHREGGHSTSIGDKDFAPEDSKSDKKRKRSNKDDDQDGENVSSEKGKMKKKKRRLRRRKSETVEHRTDNS